MSVPLLLFVLFVGVPILEIAAFIKIGGLIGVVPTLLGCVVTALIGAYVVRLQGFGVLVKAQEAIARGEMPVDQLAHGVLILVAGVLLMTPGYVTDTMGFLLLVPPLRMWIAKAAGAYLKTRANIVVMETGASDAQRSGAPPTIEGVAVDVTKED